MNRTASPEKGEKALFTTKSLYTKSGFQVNQNIEWTILSDDQCEDIYMTALELLERTGADVLSAEAREVFAKNGCYVKENRVRIPSGKIQKALTNAPKRLTLCDRNGKRAMMLESGNIHYGPGYGNEKIMDMETEEIREATKADVADIAKICGGIDDIDFVMNNGIPSDVPAAAAEVHSYEALVSNTIKPVIQEVKNKIQAEAVMEMAFTVAGSAEAFCLDPFTALLVENEESLSIDATAADVVIEAAEKGFPVIFSSKLVTGLTAPQESAGAIVCALANALVAITLAQMVASGAPVIAGGCFTIDDVANETFPIGAPEVSLLGAGLSAVLGYLNIPCFGFGGATDAKISDAQMGLESTFSLLHAGLSGTNVISGAGQMETGEYGSAFLLVMASEVMGMTRRIMKGVAMDEDRLARGVIDDVQPGGHYLGSPHTRYYFKKEQFWPKLMNRARIDDWTAAGAKTLGQRTMEMTKSILAMAEPEALPAETVAALKDIVAKAEAKM